MTFATMSPNTKKVYATTVLPGFASGVLIDAVLRESPVDGITGLSITARKLSLR